MHNCDQVISVSLFVCTLLFVVTAICGYLYYGQNVDPDLLKDFPANGYSTLARVNLIFSVDLQYCQRDSLFLACLSENLRMCCCYLHWWRLIE